MIAAIPTFIVFVIVSMAGVYIQLNYGNQSLQPLTILNTAVSAALTTALVVLYHRQSSVLESQKDLKEEEMNLEVRKEHTKVLRQRVVAWHGNTEPTQMTSTSLSEQQNKNQTDTGLPQVGRVAFKPAGRETSGTEHTNEREFRTIPPRLEDDPFLTDFLQNHANDIRKICERIEEKQESFSSSKKEFIQNFENSTDNIKTNYDFEWKNNFSLWVFNRMLIFIREPSDSGTPYGNDVEEYVNYLCKNIELYTDPVEGIQLRFNPDTDEDPVTIACSDTNGSTREPTSISPEEMTVSPERILRRELMSVIKNWPKNSIKNAGKSIEQGKEEIEKLEMKLEEYAGRPIYKHNCRYIESAKVSE